MLKSTVAAGVGIAAIVLAQGPAEARPAAAHLAAPPLATPVRMHGGHFGVPCRAAFS